jgi:hypothetical protein
MVAIPFRETIRLAKIDCQAIFWEAAMDVL